MTGHNNDVASEARKRKRPPLWRPCMRTCALAVFHLVRAILATSTPA